MPSMNPDGYSISSPGCSTFGGLGGLFGFRGRSGRNNGNNVDLNRDFPKQFDERQDVDTRTLESGRQPETVYLFLDIMTEQFIHLDYYFSNMMRWIKRNPFVLSANLHGGAVVFLFLFSLFQYSISKCTGSKLSF